MQSAITPVALAYELADYLTHQLDTNPNGSITVDREMAMRATFIACAAAEYLDQEAMNHGREIENLIPSPHVG